MPPTEWIDEANCKGMDIELFFPNSAEKPAAALEACAACKVRVECGEFAIRNGINFGVWGGMGERQRRRIRRHRRAA